MKKIFTAIFLLCPFLCVAGPVDKLVEAEYFDNVGGWTLDEQFYEQVGSAYLLANGLGKPVADATTEVKLPSSGTYHVWVRTFNWMAPWDEKEAPGVFQLLVNGKPLCDRLGDKPSSWNWQYAGKIEAGNGPLKLSLHDLTGFEGRCDAVYFSKNENPSFPVKRDSKVEKNKEKYDLIVVGGGLAGISAAVSASRIGLKVLLLDDKEYLGGISSPSHRVTVSGEAFKGRYTKIGQVVSEYGPSFHNYDEFVRRLRGENLTVLQRHRVVGVKMCGNRIKSVIAVDFKGRRNVEFSASYFADCTGDANLGVLAGAEYMMGAEASSVFGESIAPEVPDGRSYGSSLYWKAEKTGVKSSFPELSWAFRIDENTCQNTLHSRWNWEVGFKNNQIEQAEYLRDYMFRVIYGNWAYQKNAPAYAEQYADAELSQISPVLGKRESRRLKGDHILTQGDIYGKWKEYPDAAVWCTYPIDQHFPDPKLSKWIPGREFRSAMKHNMMPIGTPRRELVAGRDYNEPYMIPYRCLYSVNVGNMFMAGRNISGSRVAMCSFRVQGSTALMGEVVGLAAKICAAHKCSPREVYTKYLQELISSLEKGVPAKYDLIYTPN